MDIIQIPRSVGLLLSRRKCLQGLVSTSPRGAQTPWAALGSWSYLEQYVGGKVEDWVGEVTRLAEFARSQPQASYAAFTFGLRHRWTYFMRTLPDIENLLQPLERAISDVLIPSLIGRNCSEAERDLVALPVRMGRSWAHKSI